jgi:hypothetical protein
MSRETWERLSYVVTVIGLSLAIGVFLFEQRKERENEEEEPGFVRDVQRLAAPGR